MLIKRLYFGKNNWQNSVGINSAVLVLTLVSISLMAASCQGEISSNMSNSKADIQEIPAPTRNVSSNNVKYKPQEPRLEAKEVSNIETFDQLPENYDSRLTAILREPIPEEVIVSFYYMGARNPYPNYRWELHRDGRLFLVRHSGQNLTFEVTFDQPLPLEPTQILSNAEIQALYSKFEQVEFFEQPKLQRHLYAQDGSSVIVRARLGDTFHEVVYENVEGPLVEYLYSITD